MAGRNNRGRNLFSASSSGSKLAHARYLCLEKARAKNIGNQVLGYLESAGSIQAVKAIEARYGLADAEPAPPEHLSGDEIPYLKNTNQPEAERVGKIRIN